MPRVDLSKPVVAQVPPPAITRKDTSRAEEVIQKIVSMENEQTKNQFELIDLWGEAMEGDYIHADHCQTLPDFLKKHGLDLSPREVDYRRKIRKVSKRLGVTKEQLIQAKISKVKSIFELDPDKEYNRVVDGAAVTQTGEEVIKNLIAEAMAGRKLADIRKDVATLKGKEDTLAHETITYTFDQKEVVDRTIELIRKNEGTTYDPVLKEEKEVSRARCYEIMAINYWDDPNNRGDEVGTLGDFQDEAMLQDEDGNLYEQAD